MSGFLFRLTPGQVGTILGALHGVIQDRARIAERHGLAREDEQHLIEAHAELQRQWQQHVESQA